MSEAKDINRVIRALKKVPEKSLMIIELANSIPIVNGDLDVEELSARTPEINLAIAEASAYGRDTIQAVDALVRMGELAEPTELRPLEEEDLEEALQF